MDNSVSTGGLLDKAKQTLRETAVSLNDTGLAIHMEPTWVTVLQIEDSSENPVERKSDLFMVTSNGQQTKRIAV